MKLERFLNRSGIILIGLLLSLSFFKINGFFSNKKSEIIRSDGFGYYSYLPALFIYGDYSQNFLNEKFPKHYKGNNVPEYMQIIDNKPVDKYFFGTAVFMYPFFMTAHWLSMYFHQPADGYSILYQYFMGLAAIFYVTIGLFFLQGLLKLFGATGIQSVVICFLIAFGTNLFYYTTTEPTMSHAYSFAAITAFLFFCRSFFVNQRSVYIIPAFIALGFTILLRPFNGLILLAVPFIAGDFNTLKRSIQLLIKKYYLVLAGGLFAFLIVSLQFLIWYKQTGHFIVYSYTYERFYFDKPHLLQVLFSYRKGIFIYTPLCFVALAGLIYLWKNNKFQTLTFLGFFLVLTYIMSCWHQWFYGGSLGFRPIIEYLSLFAILLLFAFRLINRRWMRTVAIFLCLFFVYVNQVQAYQYPRFILHWENMSKYKFWKVFLRTDDKWIGYVWENPEPADIDGDKVAEYFTDFEQPDKNWTGSAMYDQGAKAHSGKMVTGLFENVIYSNTMILKGDEKLAAMNKPAVFIRGYTHQDGLLKSNELKFVISYDKPEGGTYYYKSRLVDNFTASDKGWKKFEIALTIDKLKSKGDLIKMYFWNPEKKAYLIDDITITFIDAY